MKPAVYILAFAALFAAGCGKWEIPPLRGDESLPNVTIGELRAYSGDAALTIADDIVIAGRVVSSDRAGNFYNTFFIDDGTGAVEIMAGMPDLHAAYPEGRRVIVRAQGLAAGWNGGAMQLGLPPEPGSGFATGYFYHPAVIRRHVFRDSVTEAVEPMTVEAAWLNVSMCGRLVRIAGLYPDTSETAGYWAVTAPLPQTGYRKFFTADRLDSVTIVTSGYAHFAGMPLPSGETSVTGILLYGRGGSSKNHFLIKPRYEKDLVY